MGRSDKPSSALVVTNPGAGAAGDVFVTEVLDTFAHHIPQVWRIDTVDPEEAVEQISSSLQRFAPELVVSIGGDGTARTVAEGMARSAGHWRGEPLPPSRDGQPSLLVLPAGSGNSLYSLLWPDTPWRAAVQGVFAGEARQLRADLIQLRELDGASLLGTNFGLFADTAVRIEQMKAASGAANGADERYAMAFAEALNNLQPIEFRVAVDGEPLHHGIASMVTVGGAPRFAGGKTTMLPEAAIDDGLLDVCVVEAHTAEELTALAPLAVTGDHTGQPGVHYVQGREVLVERLDGADLSAERDGDPWPAGASVTLGVMPGAVPLLAANVR